MKHFYPPDKQSLKGTDLSILESLSGINTTLAIYEDYSSDKKMHGYSGIKKIF